MHLNHFLIKTLLFILALCLLPNCGGGGSLLGKNPRLQRYKEQPIEALSKIPGAIQQAVFPKLTLKRGYQSDLVLLVRDGDKKPELHVLLNQGKGRFLPKDNVRLDENTGLNIFFIAAADLNRDGAEDLILLGRSGDGVVAKVFFNNKKGYFYEKPDSFFPPIHKGIERVDPVDVDRDGNIDLFFSGAKVMDVHGKIDKFQAQVMVNNGKGQFKDDTALLLPPLRPGIVATVFADYDGDEVSDVFLVYGSGQNALLINNGLGKFSDETGNSLPPVTGRSTHADWADFDGDKDNDILVVSTGIDEKYRDYPSEYSYILENNGRGRFKKRPLKVLPNIPSHRVYLLDVDGNKTTDAIILTQEGPQLLKGVGKWGFSLETRGGLPNVDRVKEMSFGDVDGDGYLDIFLIVGRKHMGKLWMNSFD